MAARRARPGPALTDGPAAEPAQNLGMGEEIEQERFDEADYRRFEERLDQCLATLSDLLGRPGFGAGELTIGAELELDLVDAGTGRPALLNQQVLSAARDPLVTVEMDRFNLEINTDPVPLRGAPFSALARTLEEKLRRIRVAAARHAARPVIIGILPTLVPGDLDEAILTQRPRYRALRAGIDRRRWEPRPLQIDGKESLSLPSADVALAGANTSFQVHLKVPPGDFARMYNAAQIACAPAVALAGNSPLLFGRHLWEETRLALFGAAIDERPPAAGESWRAARASFGYGWVRTGPLELFTEAVRLHEPLLPLVSDEDPRAAARAGGVPGLHELKLHNGTVWRWNRPVYDRADGGHVRIELRPLPSGPTVTDMVGNAAFLLGLTLGLVPAVEPMMCALTFVNARRNFYKAACLGLEAELVWPGGGGRPQLAPVTALWSGLLATARRGLLQAQVDESEVDGWLAVAAERVTRGATGARWQTSTFHALRAAASPREASQAMLRRYIELSDSNQPVHTWPAR
jgi:hypothetical protein